MLLGGSEKHEYIEPAVTHTLYQFYKNAKKQCKRIVIVCDGMDKNQHIVGRCLYSLLNNYSDHCGIIRNNNNPLTHFYDMKDIIKKSKLMGECRDCAPDNLIGEPDNLDCPFCLVMC